MKTNPVTTFVVALLALIFISGCAQVPTQQTLVGFDGLDHETGIKTDVRMQENEIYLTVRNQYQKDYQVWVVFKFRSPFQNRYTEQRIHEGNEYQRDFIVTIPDDLNDKSRESVKVYITSIENYDIDAVVSAIDFFSGDTMMDGFSTITGISVLNRTQYFQTPEIVLNGHIEEESYSNTLHDNFKEI